jgi:hypothetical protein
MVTLLFTGCGKDKSPGIDPDILEGTWRWIEEIKTVTFSDPDLPEEEPVTTPYPHKREIDVEEDEDIDFYVIYQPYFQIKNNIITIIMKCNPEGEIPADVKNTYPRMTDLEQKGLLIKLDEFEYSVTGDKLIISVPEEENITYTYVISGKTMSMKTVYSSEDGYLEKNTNIKLVKVGDSEVTGVENREDLDLPDFLKI